MSTTLEAAAKKFPLKGHPVLTNSGPAAKAVPANTPSARVAAPSPSIIFFIDISVFSLSFGFVGAGLHGPAFSGTLLRFPEAPSLP